jgi:hypothetical protein
VADTITTIATVATVIAATVAAVYSYKAAVRSARAAEQANELMSEANLRMLEANALVREQIERQAYQTRTGGPYGERSRIRTGPGLVELPVQAETDRVASEPE